ncbi:MAG: hypothetical protein R3B70_14760 [Polyangiaceae bacterium]
MEPGTPVGLLVRREGLIDRARTLLGGQDLRTGDAAFDPAFLVQANDPDRALAALDSADVRALLLELYPGSRRSLSLTRASSSGETPPLAETPSPLHRCRVHRGPRHSPRERRRLPRPLPLTNPLFDR